MTLEPNAVPVLFRRHSWCFTQSGLSDCVSADGGRRFVAQWRSGDSFGFVLYHASCTTALNATPLDIFFAG